MIYMAFFVESMSPWIEIVDEAHVHPGHIGESAMKKTLSTLGIPVISYS